MNKFHCDHIISLGFFCSPALELDRLGYRNASYPFDWVISNMRSVSNLIDNQFRGLFELKDLYEARGSDLYTHVHHSEYCFQFFHDFKIGTPWPEQINSVRDKYQRRISRFYDTLSSNENIVFLLYSRNNDTQDDLNKLVESLSRLTVNFRIIIISNKGNHSYILSEYILSQLFVEKDINDVVNRKFFNDIKTLDGFKRDIVFSTEKIIANILKKELNIKLLAEKNYNFGQLEKKYSHLFFQGWGNGGDHGKWTIGYKSILNLIFDSKDIKNQIIISFNIRKVIEDVELQVFANNKILEHEINGNELIIIIPFSRLTKLSFLIKGQISSPKDRGVNSDKRLLGYLFSSFSYILK